MSNDKWSEQRIEQLLSQAPKMNDDRSKEEVFNRLKKDHIMIKKPRMQRRWAPPAVVVAAILTLTVVTVSYLNQDDHISDSASHMELSSENDETSQRMMGTASEEEAKTPKEADGENISMSVIMEEEPLSNSLYSSEKLDDVTIFNIGLVANDANSVPITFLIPNDQITEDIGDKTPSYLELYQHYAPLINEEELGFMDYHPYKGAFTIEGDSLILTLPKDHTYDLGSGSINAFKQSLQDTFENYNQVMFRNEDGSAIEFDQVGEIQPYNLRDGTLYNYYMYQDLNGRKYLTPNFGKSFKSLSDLPEALQGMKDSQNDIYSSVIPENITFETTTKNDITYVRFSNALNLKQMDSAVAMNMIEGMLLTGARFGSQLQFENVVQTNWNGFDFTQPLPIPIGPNEMPLQLNQ